MLCRLHRIPRRGRAVTSNIKAHRQIERHFIGHKSCNAKRRIDRSRAMTTAMPCITRLMKRCKKLKDLQRVFSSWYCILKNLILFTLRVSMLRIKRWGHTKAIVFLKVEWMQRFLENRERFKAIALSEVFVTIIWPNFEVKSLTHSIYIVDLEIAKHFIIYQTCLRVEIFRKAAQNKKQTIFVVFWYAS